MDRGEVHDVEAHRGDRGQTIDAVAKRSVPSVSALGSREELVSCGGLSKRAVDDPLELAVVRRRRASIGIGLDQLGRLLAQQELRAVLRSRRALELCEQHVDSLLVRSQRALEGGAEQ